MLGRIRNQSRAEGGGFGAAVKAGFQGRTPPELYDLLKRAGVPLPDADPTEPWLLCWEGSAKGRYVSLRSISVLDRRSRSVIERTENKNVNTHSLLVAATSRRVAFIADYANPKRVRLISFFTWDEVAVETAVGKGRVDSWTFDPKDQNEPLIEVSWEYEVKGPSTLMGFAAVMSAKDPANVKAAGDIHQARAERAADDLATLRTVMEAIGRMFRTISWGRASA